MSTNKITARIEAYQKARENWEAAKEVASKLYKPFYRAEQELQEAMLEARQRRVDHDDGCQFRIDPYFGFSLTKDNTEQVYNWLMGAAGDVTPFMREVLYKPSVYEWLKKKVESGEIPETRVPKFLKLTNKPHLVVQGWDKRKKEEDQ